ncbi:hypothetical protein H5410_034994 [Solanum commersonii]|uniref:Uncharacterized protein n=1 Tax=Solanum commersonii TaxID=4109 RepID=A0A9J5Y1D1_SOLCO|nr:hypothetical protein H5410_034994 [Solanum commersonii]
MGGRSTLINSALDSIPTRLIGIRRNSLWDGNKKFHGPKQLGGLGIKDLALRNKCLLMKWLWSPKSLVLQAIQIPTWCSVGLWKSICKLKDEFFQNTKLAAGNGIHRRFRKDRIRWATPGMYYSDWDTEEVINLFSRLEGQAMRTHILLMTCLITGHGVDMEQRSYASAGLPFMKPAPLKTSLRNENSRLPIDVTIAADLWSLFLSIFGINWVMPHSTKEAFECWCNWRVGKAIKPI